MVTNANSIPIPHTIWLHNNGFLSKMSARTLAVAKVTITITIASFMDDTDLFIFKSCLDTECKLFSEAQILLSTWGTTLVGTGGILKPEKCHYYMWGFECREGKWECVDLRDHPELKVPTPSGKGVPIEQLPVTSSKKILGLYANPAGCCMKQVDVRCDIMQRWTDRLCSGRLPSKWGWTSYRRQLWPKLAYGLGTHTATIKINRGDKGREGRPTGKRRRRPKMKETEAVATIHCQADAAMNQGQS